MSDLEPSGAHTAACTVWTSDTPCDCGADSFPLPTPDAGTAAEPGRVAA